MIFFNKILKKLRNLNELTLEKLAKELKLKLSVIKGYEFYNKIPPIPTLIRLSKYFGVSIDFLLLDTQTFYIKNIKLLKLAKKIDHFNMNERYKVEGSASALIGKIESKFKIKIDNLDIELTDSFHKNIKLLRQERKLTQLELAKKINTKRLQVALYEKQSYPRIEKILNLSEKLNISIHALLTGEKLSYYFENNGLQQIILKADHLLPLKDHQFLIHLMQRIIEDSNLKNS